MFKSALIMLLFASPAFAQSSAAIALGATGCGTDEIRFDMKTNKNQHPTAQPDPGKALVYVIGNSWVDHVDVHIGVPPTRFGVDGTWVGANGYRSYFFFPVEPGDHRLCTNMESHGKGHDKCSTAATSFTVQAGMTYYFRTKSPDGSDTELKHVPTELNLVPVDPAEAQVLIDSAAHSTFHVKK